MAENIGLESSALSDEESRAFEEWVGRRLADWSAEEIRGLERWLLDDCRFEFIPAVRKAWTEASAA
jgi:hypothetical protein